MHLVMTFDSWMYDLSKYMAEVHLADVSYKPSCCHFLIAKAYKGNTATKQVTFLSMC